MSWGIEFAGSAIGACAEDGERGCCRWGSESRCKSSRLLNVFIKRLGLAFIDESGESSLADVFATKDKDLSSQASSLDRMRGSVSFTSNSPEIFTSSIWALVMLSTIYATDCSILH